MKRRELFNKLPGPVRRGVKSLYGYFPSRLRYGKDFRDTYAFLEESQWWSKERLQEYQLHQLHILLMNAYENVPYYRKVFEESAVHPNDIKSLDDLGKIPYLTKDAIRGNSSELVSRKESWSNLEISHTSGTSGKPLQFYTKFSNKLKELAFIYHQWSRVGIKPGTPMVQLRGAIISGKENKEYDPVFKVLRLSPVLDGKDKVSYYLDEMKRLGAEYLHGYPSSIADFAFKIQQYGLPVPFMLTAVLFASEAVYNWEREIVQEVFDCRIYSHYGMAEQAVLAGECEKSHSYHCIPQYGITETDAETNEIIGTGFINHITPFIRYRTTDVAQQSSASGCSDCGRDYFPVFDDVEGRLEDYIITPDGVRIAPAIITHPFKDFTMIRNTQVIQESMDSLILKIVAWDDADREVLAEETDRLIRDLQEIVGPKMRIESSCVDSIDLTKSGKFKWIISRVSKGILEKGHEGTEIRS